MRGHAKFANFMSLSKIQEAIRTTNFTKLSFNFLQFVSDDIRVAMVQMGKSESFLMCNARPSIHWEIVNSVGRGQFITTKRPL